jgi:hypothetical protein
MKKETTKTKTVVRKKKVVEAPVVVETPVEAPELVARRLLKLGK